MSVNPKANMNEQAACSNGNEPKGVEQKKVIKVIEQKADQAPAEQERERRYCQTWMGPVELHYNPCSGQYERPDPRDYDPSV